ncbi:hypothetical protein GPECTOR_21g602 [Gonium pectorale]|uniref:Protein kinase domain-containing protein n=1 Tax=Gonium pectorale TaxID=33097 RepID=A0A150GHS3_GONPE|nr:hypothetical protein GPECTOR_21g602 [Gonium pectorale]|eukprot:KXZ49376.1 hypothetical protein GPECTOR_21g602 [Gonium pectorale]
MSRYEEPFRALLWSNVEYTTADELVKDVQDLKWLGQGAQGVVYEGIWQGATVAVKFSIVEDLDTTAYELLFSKLLSHPNVVQTFLAKVAVLDERTIHASQDCSVHLQHAASAGRSLSQPPTMASLPLHHHHHHHHQHSQTRPRNPNPSHSGIRQGAADTSNSLLYRPSEAAGAPAGAEVTAARSSAQLLTTSPGAAGAAPPSCCPSRPASGDLAALGLPARLDSFHSDDGFGDPFGRKCTFTDVREVLASMGAKPGHYIAQMVMEHCDHGSLHSAIQRGIFKPASRWGPKLALRALIRTVREVAQGMFHLHSNNVLHGDLKPANVLLINSRKDRRGYVAKVSDFGLAQFCCKDHISNAPWGTLVYMAPERLLHGQLFPASDVYSFGVMLWEMHHGQRPYEGLHAAQIVMIAAQGGCSSYLTWSQDACEDIVRISQECMAPSPHDRPTFADLMRQLALLEARVRQEGAAAGGGSHVSISMERPTRASSRLSQETNASLPFSVAPSGALTFVSMAQPAAAAPLVPPQPQPAHQAHRLHRAATGPIPVTVQRLSAELAGSGGRRGSHELTGRSSTRSRLSAETCRHPTAPGMVAAVPPPPPAGAALPHSPVKYGGAALPLHGGASTANHHNQLHHNHHHHNTRVRRSVTRGPSFLGIASVPEESVTPPMPSATATMGPAAAAAAAGQTPPDGGALTAVLAQVVRAGNGSAGGGGSTAAADDGSGRRSGGSGAAAIAAALAAQPAMANAVVAELLVRLGQQTVAPLAGRKPEETALAVSPLAQTATVKLPLAQSTSPFSRSPGRVHEVPVRQNSSPAGAIGCADGMSMPYGSGGSGVTRCRTASGSVATAATVAGAQFPQALCVSASLSGLVSATATSGAYAAATDASGAYAAATDASGAGGGDGDGGDDGDDGVGELEDREARSAPLYSGPRGVWTAAAAAAAVASGSPDGGSRSGSASGASAPLPAVAAASAAASSGLLLASSSVCGTSPQLSHGLLQLQLQRQLSGLGAGGGGAGPAPGRVRSSCSRPRECPTITEEPN